MSCATTALRNNMEYKMTNMFMRHKHLRCWCTIYSYIEIPHELFSRHFATKIWIKNNENLSKNIFGLFLPSKFSIHNF